MRTAKRRLTGGLLLAVAAYYALWGGEYSALDLRRLESEQQQEAAELARLESEIDSLQALVARLESDPATIERVARERFGMIRDGERLYRFVQVDGPAKPTEARLARRP